MPDDERTLLASVFYAFVLGVGIVLIVLYLIH